MAKVDKKEKKVKDAKPVKAAVKEVINKVKDGKKDKKENEVKKSPTKSKKAAPPPPKPESLSESGDSDSDDEEPSKKAAPVLAVKAVTSSDDTDDEPAHVAKKADSSDSSDDSDVEMKDAAPATNGKRKAADDAPLPPKKAKIAKDDAAPATSGETEGNNIFVGQLSWNVDDDRFAAEFADCGEILQARVQTDRNTGKSRGFGYLTFATPEGAQKALAMSGQEIDGRPIHVDVSTPRAPRDAPAARKSNDQQSEPSSTLFVGNLSFDANEDNVWEFFSEHGVKSVRLPTDRDTGRPKGFGYIEFESVDGAKAALEASSGAEIAGRAIRLDYSQPRDSSGGGRGGFGGDRGGGRGFGGRGRGGDRGGRGGGRGFGGRGGGDRGFGGRGRGGDRRGRGRN